MQVMTETGAKRAERGPTTTGYTPAATPCQDSYRSASGKAEWRTATLPGKRPRKRPTTWAARPICSLVG